MAMQKVEVELSIDNKQGIVNLQFATAEMKRFETAVIQASKNVTGFQTNFVESFKNMKNVGLGFSEALNMMENVFGKGVSKAMQYELSVAKLTGVIASGGKQAEVSAAQLERFAGQMSKEGFISKADVLDIERYFLTFKNIGGASIQKATEAVIGLQQALDLGDSRSATIALARALDQGSEGMRSLNKMGLKLQADELEHVKTLEAEGKTYEMQSYIIDLLSKKYSELGEEIRKTTAFSQNQMQKTMAGFQKEAGMIILTATHPMVAALNDVLTIINKLPAPVKGFIGLVAELTVALGVLNTTGVGQSILGLMRMGPTLNTYRAKALEAAFSTNTLTAAQEQQTYASWEAAVANKGWFASLGPLGWAIVAIGALGTAWGLMRDEVLATFTELSEEEKQLHRQSVEFKELAKQIANTSLAEKERKQAIADMQAKYPEYLNSKQIDLSNEKQMNDTLAAGNRLFEERIKMKGMERQLEKKADEIAALRVQNTNLENKKKTAPGSNMPAGGQFSTGVVNYGSVEQLDAAIKSNDDKIKTLEEDFTQISKDMKPKDTTGGVKEDPVEIAKELLKKTTNGLTNDAVDRFVQELRTVNGKLGNGTDLSKQVEKRISDLSGKDRFGKTGGNGLGYFVEDTKIELKNVTEISGLYEKINNQMAKIEKGFYTSDDSTKMSKEEKATQNKEKAKYKLRSEFESVIDNLARMQMNEAENTAEASGDTKVEQLVAKKKILLDIIAEIKNMSEKWNTSHPDYPLVSKQKMMQLGGELLKLNNDIQRELFDQNVSKLEDESSAWDKQLEILKATDMEKLAWKKMYLEAQLKMAAEYNQKEKAIDLQHKLDLLESDTVLLGDKMKSAERNNIYSIGISRANRNYRASGSSKYSLEAERLGEEQQFANEKERVQNDGLLTDASKQQILEEMERAHGDRMADIKRKYYDAWMGDLLGFGKREIEATQQILGQAQEAANSLYEMQSASGKKTADDYRKHEYDKLDADKKAELAKAHTEKQKNAIEEKYAKRKEQIDEEANKRGQEKARSMFVAMKAMQIAQAIINTYSAADKALNSGLPPPLNFILMGTTIAAGLANVAKISAQEMPKMATGGIVKGRGTGTSDSVATWLSDGEYIVNADAARRNKMLLDNINYGGNEYAPGSMARLQNMQIINAGNSREMQELKAEMQTITSAIEDLHRALATGGILAKVTGDTAAKITSTGLGRLKKRGA